jgi:3-methyladenine DNA glycosylase AlkC
MRAKQERLTPARLKALAKGEVESANLMEWTALDMGALLVHVLREGGVKAPEAAWLELVRALPLTRRIEAIALHLLDRHPELFEGLAEHPSDTVRIWAAMMVGLGPKRNLERRLAQLRPFATDPHAGVREYAWMAFRPHLSAQLPEGLILLEAEAHAPDENVRRFASEVSRPRGVWCTHIQALKQQPQQARALLDALRADPSRYVQTSVANWINDASKDQAAWVRELARDWELEPHPHTQWILHHGLRTLRKRQAWGVS